MYRDNLINGEKILRKSVKLTTENRIVMNMRMLDVKEKCLRFVNYIVQYIFSREELYTITDKTKK